MYRNVGVYIVIHCEVSIKLKYLQDPITKLQKLLEISKFSINIHLRS